MAPQGKIPKERRKKRKEGGGKEEEDSSFPNRIGEGVLLSTSASAPLGPLCPKASPSPPLIYTGGFRVFDTQLFHVQLKPIPHSSSSRSYFCGARAEPCRSRSSPSAEHCHAVGELMYFFISLAGSRRPRLSSSCTCAECVGAVRSALNRKDRGTVRGAVRGT